MSPVIIAAIIAGVFSIVSPIATYFVTQAYRDRIFLPPPSGRAKALVGKWQGTLHEEIGPEGTPFDASFSLELAMSWKVVSGTAGFHATLLGKEYEFKLVLRGGFLYERFLRFDYQNCDESVLQFGSMTFELSADGQSLDGRFLGYGDVSKRLVYGTIELHKHP
jgi:hypothetical protein